MPEWITPKTNWKNGDYYNLEDAERFANNLECLYTLARRCYNLDPIHLLIYRVSRNWGYYCADYSIYWNDMVIPSSQSGTFNIFSRGLKTLFYLECIHSYGTPYELHNGYPLRYASEYLTPKLWLDVNVGSSESSAHYQFTGWYLYHEPVGGEPSDYLGRIWSSDFHLDIFYDLICPFTSIASDSGACTITVNKTDVLANTVFPNAKGLNKIESMMASQYAYFTALVNRFFPYNE